MKKSLRYFELRCILGSVNEFFSAELIKMAANELVQKRGHIMGALTKLNSFAAAISAETTLEDIEVRSCKMEEYFKEFSTVENKLLLLPDQTSKYDEFETKYFKVKAIFVREMRKRQKVDAPQVSPIDFLNKTIDNLCAQQLQFFDGMRENTLSQTNQDIRLPRVIIEPFSGLYSQWPSFKDLYKASVHSNDALSDSHKFQLLKSFLRGEAADLIRYIPVTDLNYSEAWEKLQARYDKRKSVVNSLIEKFVKQKPLQHFNVPDLRRIADVSDGIVRELKCLGTQHEQRDPWLIYLIINKLDLQTKEAWAQFSVDKESPSFEEFLKFLDKRCDTFESCLPAKMPAPRFLSTTKIPTRVNLQTTTDQVKCPCCNKGNHPLYKCFKFKRMNVSDRVKLAKDSKLCFNCLTHFHITAECSSSFSCRICGQRHNTMVHENTTHEKHQAQSNTLHSTVSLQLPDAYNLEPSNNPNGATA